MNKYPPYLHATGPTASEIFPTMQKEAEVSPWLPMWKRRRSLFRIWRRNSWRETFTKASLQRCAGRASSGCHFFKKQRNESGKASGLAVVRVLALKEIPTRSTPEGLMSQTRCCNAPIVPAHRQVKFFARVQTEYYEAVVGTAAVVGSKALRRLTKGLGKLELTRKTYSLKLLRWHRHADIPTEGRPQN